MSPRDDSAPLGASTPTATRTGDHAVQNGPYPAPPHSTRTDELSSPSVFDQHVEPGVAPVTVNQAEDRRDRVRWGPIWAGAVVVLTVFIVLQLLFFALGWLDLGVNNGSGVLAGIVTGVLALFAFFVGGLTAGASTMWRKAGDGMLHGVLVWALSVLGILALALIGGSALLGPLANLISQAPDAAGQATQAAQNADPVQALSTARRSAGWTALGLGAAVAAAAIGGIAGSKIWPGRTHTDTNTHRTVSA